MQTWLRDLAGACIFYSIIPVPKWLKPSFKRIAQFAPLIGIAIGSLQSLLWILCTSFGWSNISTSLLVVAFGAWITGGLHLDGLMDTFDGIAAGPQRCTKAMSDSRVGAGGVQSLCLVLLIQIAALIRLESMAILAFPTISFFGRCAPLWAIGNFPYLKENGKSSFHRKNRNGIRDGLPSLIILLFILTITLSISLSQPLRLYLILTILFGILLTFLVPEYLGRKLGGHSGDSYGASLVLVETLMLIFMGFTLEII